MSKFDDYFKDPVWFTNGCYVLSGKVDKVEAAEVFSHCLGEDVFEDDIESDRVRFQFPGEDIEDAEKGVSLWCSGATGKGSLPVWVFYN